MALNNGDKRMIALVLKNKTHVTAKGYADKNKSLVHLLLNQN